MPRTILQHDLIELSHKETPEEVLIKTKPNTEIHIEALKDVTVVRLSYGNKFDVINGRIYIYELKN